MKHLFAIFCLVTFLLADVNAQCYPDRHSTNWFDGWISCEARQSPNPDRAEGHWIMYDYGDVYILHQMHIWNTNDPAHLDRGMQEVAIDYSLDGITWQSAGEYQLAQAPGVNTYEGTPGPDLGGIEAQYLLITGLSNYGGACFGLGEVQIEAEEAFTSASEDLAENPCYSVKILPNPFSGSVGLRVNSECAGLLHYAVFDVLGNPVLNGQRPLGVGTDLVTLRLHDVPAGNYFLSLRMGDMTHREKLVKLSR